MAIKKTIELEARVGKAEKDLQGVAKSVQKIDKNLEDVKDTTGGVAKGVRGIGNALKAAGIGLAIAAFAKLTEVFNQNQKVTNAFNTAFEALSLAFNDFFNFLESNISTVTGYFKTIFNDPIQAIQDFSSAIFDGIVARFKQAVEAIGIFGSAINKFFSGDFVGAAMLATEAGKELFDVVTGEDGGYEKIVEGTKTAISAISNYTKSTIAAAQETVELNRAAEVGIAQNRIILEQKDREAEKLRQIRDDEKLTIDERIEANNKLAEVLNEQERLMLANADAVIAAAQAQFDKNANDENQIALLEARAEKEGILAQIEGFRSEQLMNVNSLERESLDIQKEVTDAKLELQMLELDNAQSAFGLLSEMAGKSRALQAISIVGENAVAAAKQIISTKAANAAVTAKYALLPGGALLAAAEKRINNISLGLGLAASAVATGKALSALKAGGGSQASSFRGGIGGEGGGATSPTQAPAFNVVGASPENQLAQAIGQREQQPVKAFVVSNDVTNAQALDRNIVQSASLG